MEARHVIMRDSVKASHTPPSGTVAKNDDSRAPYTDTHVHAEEQHHHCAGNQHHNIIDIR